MNSHKDKHNVRNVDKTDIIKKFNSMYETNKLDSIKWMFYTGDIRCGLGERDVFNILFENLSTADSLLAAKLVKYIPLYCRWDLLLNVVINEAYPESVKNEASNIMKTQLNLDKERMSENKVISLMAKWLPSSNTGNKNVREKAYIIRQVIDMRESDYRKMLSTMRKYIESKSDVMKNMTQNEWDILNAPTLSNEEIEQCMNSSVNKFESNQTEILNSGRYKVIESELNK